MSKEEKLRLMVWIPIIGTQDECSRKLQVLIQGIGAGTDMGPPPSMLALTLAKDIMDSVRKMKAGTGSMNLDISTSNIGSPLKVRVVREK